MDHELITIDQAPMEKMLVQVNDILDTAKTVKVETQEHAEHATTLLSVIKGEAKKAEDARKNIVKPHNDAVREFNAWVKENITDPLNAAEITVKDALKPFLIAEEKRQREEAEARRKAEQEKQDKERQDREEATLKEAERLQAEGKTDEAEKVLNEGAEESAAAAVTLPEVQTKRGPTRGSYGGTASLRKVWAYRLDPKMKPEEAVKLVPDAYLIPPEERLSGKVIRAAISGEKGLREIPGLEIYQESSLASR